MCMTVYLLGCTGWQELDSISLISGNTIREEDSVLLSIVVQKGDQAFISSIVRACLGFLLQLPCILVVSPEAR